MIKYKVFWNDGRTSIIGGYNIGDAVRKGKFTKDDMENMSFYLLADKSEDWAWDDSSNKWYSKKIRSHFAHEEEIGDAHQLKLRGCKEQFRRKDLTRIGFHKAKGYRFAKVDKENPGHGWLLMKDNTSTLIKKLVYTDMEKKVYYPKSFELTNVNELAAACEKVKEMFINSK